MPDIEVKIELDSKELDTMVEKAKQTVGLLKEAQQIVSVRLAAHVSNG